MTPEQRAKHSETNSQKQTAMARYLLKVTDQQRRTLLNAMKPETAEKVRQKYEQFWAENVLAWDATVRRIYLNTLKRMNPARYERISDLIEKKELEKC